jgi:hypothetical protein
VVVNINAKQLLLLLCVIEGFLYFNSNEDASMDLNSTIASICEQVRLLSDRLTRISNCAVFSK